MITIKDIAARLGVSWSTVGRALADDPRISKATKQRVLEAANEMGYVANRAARMMRGVSSNLVGLILPDIRNSFYYTIAHGLSKCLEGVGFQLTLSETNDDRRIELHHIRELTSVGVAGIIIVPSAKPRPETVRLLKMTPHIQLLRKFSSLGDQWFGIDDVHSLYLSARHVVQFGHKKVAYIGGNVDLPTGADRLQGFRNALAGADAVEGAIEILGPPSSSDFGREAIRKLLKQSPRPTAIVTGSVQITRGVLEELYEQQVPVPNDLSVVGFGDESGYQWWGPGLTTVTPPVSDLATACGLWFVHQIKQQTLGKAPFHSIFPPALVVRGSCGAPRAGASSRIQDHVSQRPAGGKRK